MQRRATRGNGGPPTRRQFLGNVAATAGVLAAGSMLGCQQAAVRVAAAPRKPMPFLPVDKLTVTCVVDYSGDATVKGGGGNDLVVQRPPSPRGAAATGDRNAYLQSEYGVALLLESEQNGKKFTILHDFGLTGSALVNNLDFLGFNPSAVDALILSHGHADHYAGLPRFLHTYGDRIPRGTPFFFGHEHAFAPRWSIREQKKKFQGQLDRKLLDKVSLERVDESEIVGGQVMITTRAPMESEFEGKSPAAHVEAAGKMSPDEFIDETALTYHVKGKGLVVITGCGHRGMVNTIRHAVRATGVDQVFAVLGGLHLAKARPPKLAAAIAELTATGVQRIIPMHCVGSQRTVDLMSALPERTVFNTTGTRYVF